MTSNKVQSIPRTMSPTLTLQLGVVIRIGIHIAILGGKLAHRKQAQQTWKDYSQLTVAKRLYVLIVSYEERFFLKTNTSTMVVLFKDY